LGKLESATLTLCFILFIFCIQPAFCWSNGGYSTSSSQPKYGTHDWIAQHALDWLPQNEKQYITDNLAAYLYGTELPDNSQAPDGIGDASAKHHFYFNADGSIEDDSSGQRASEEFQKALAYLQNKDFGQAAKEAGIMSHYIDDMAVFAHVMGKPTVWGNENHHSDYEDHVDDRTESNISTFDSYLQFDGALTAISAYDAAKNLAYDTTFGGGSGYSCTWMDANYDWNNPAFSNRCGQSLNLAVNAVADVLHALAVNAGISSNASNSTTATATPTPTAPEFPTVQILIIVMLAAVASAIVYQKKRL
jgi:hypothetical protein